VTLTSPSSVETTATTEVTTTGDEESAGSRRRRAAASHDVDLVAVDPPVKDGHLRAAVVATKPGTNTIPCIPRQCYQHCWHTGL